MANKRVINMQELSELGDGWYTFLDSATGGTKKFDMGNMLNATADAQDAAEAAQSAATSAREAADGVVSPTVTPSQITGGTRVTITDVDGTRTFDVMDGPQGEKGDTGDPAAPGSITTDMLADGAVTTDKLAPGVADGYQPTLAAGSSRAMLGDPETASWMERTTAADGAALIEAICGNTIVESGSLLPVRMTGVETVGFNQWDEQWEVGTVSASTGELVANDGRIRNKNYVPVFPNTTYFHKTTARVAGDVAYYDEGKNYVGGSASLAINHEFTTPANARYMKFSESTGYGNTYKHDICINISDPSRNGTYEPYWRSERTIHATDLRSAGTVYDEQTATERITRVGEVDLGTLNWTESPTIAGSFNSSTIRDIAVTPNANRGNITCAVYQTYSADTVDSSTAGISSGVNQTKTVRVHDPMYAGDAAAFKTAMSGVMLHYALATPTTTPIDPPLPLSYRTGAGGTERVMVASGTQSAPPVFVTRYPLDPADLAASIAPVDGPIAKTNHQVGDLIMLGFTLCKVTTSIARGEAITIGTNVTKTSVAAEIAALS